MKIERWECDRCHGMSNGDILDWFTVHPVRSGIVEIGRLRVTSVGDGRHACGEVCALSLVAEELRGLPK